MPRLRQVPRAEADPKVAVPMYDQLFGDRDPVAEPGTATGTPGQLVDRLRPRARRARPRGARLRPLSQAAGRSTPASVSSA